MFLFLDYYNLSLFLGGLVALLSGAAVYFNDHRKIENKAWMLLNISTAVWSFGYFAMITSTDTHHALSANWILHAGAILIPIFYLFFITTLTQTTSAHRGTLVTLLFVAFYFLYQNTSSSFVQGVFSKGPFSFAPDAGPLYIYFALYFFAVVLYAFTILEEKIKTTEKQEAVKLRYVLYSSLAGFVGGGFVFFLTFNIPTPPYPLVLFTFYPLIIAYAMLKHKLFEVKIAATEILLGSVWVGLLFFTLLEESIGKQIVFGIIFVFIVIVGVILIHLLYRDVERREQIEKLAEELEDANKGQENLIHTLSHQVKGGLARAGGLFASILEGDYNDNPPKMTEMLKEALRLNRRDVASLEQTLLAFNPKFGTEAYDMQMFDFKDALLETVTNLKSEADDKKLTIAMHINEKENYELIGDREKIVSRVLHNLIENAILYTPTGGFSIDLHKVDNKILLMVKDTGTGITPEDMRILFTRGGHGKDSLKVNVHSIGDGLYLAKVIVEKHHGKIWAESEGAGKGATFFVEVPAAI